MLSPLSNDIPVQAVIEASPSLEPNSWVAITDPADLSQADPVVINLTQDMLNGFPFVRVRLSTSP